MPPTTQDDLSQYEVKPQAQGDDLSKYEVKPQAAPTWDQQHPVLSDMASRGKDLAKGVGEGLLQTGTSLSPLINKIPYVGETLAPSSGIKRAQELATPANTTQQIGKTGEQIAEFFVQPEDTLAEHAGVAAGKLAPQLGRVAPYVAKIGAGALEAGVRNKLQGGSFTTGAEMGGAATAILPPVARAVEGVMPPEPTEKLATRILRGAGKGATIGGAMAAANEARDPMNALAHPAQTAEHIAGRAGGGAFVGGASPIIDKINRGVLSRIGEYGEPSAPTASATSTPPTTPPTSSGGNGGTPPPIVPPIKPQATGKMVDEMLQQIPGNEPLKPNVPLREQIKTPMTEAQAETDPMKVKYPDSAVRQMARANGEKIVDAVGGDSDLMKQVHDLTRVDLRQALINSGEDMGQTTVSDSKFAGQGSIGRQQAFEKLLDKGLKPADIVRLAKQPLKP